MKRIFCFMLVVFSFASCRKEIKTEKSQSSFSENIKSALKDSLSADDYSNLDFGNSLVSKSDKQQVFYLRVPFTGKKISEDFVLVKITPNGKVLNGKIIHLKIEKLKLVSSGHISSIADGNITISSFNRRNVLNSSITNGYITAFHNRVGTRTMLKEADMPEVVVVAYVYNYDTSLSTWLWLSNLMYDSEYGGGGYGGDVYGSDGGGYTGSGNYGGGSGGSGSNGNGGTPQEDLQELEYIESKPEIDVWKYFNCFDNVPSAGASYSIKLCSDIPSNSNPYAYPLNLGSSVGHSFLTITKSNGTATVTQSFGFYPRSTPSVLDPFGDVTSAIRDNGGNEYNAAIEMQISEAQFNVIKNDAIVWAVKPYNLADYNCTSYALDLFNSIRTNPISIAPYTLTLPSGPTYGSSKPNTLTFDKTPQMLFVKLQEMKNTGGPEAAKIEIDQSHNSLSPVSHGECN